MSADYTDGYNDGYAAGESAGKRKEEDLKKLLKAAQAIINAYGEDEGYTPSRVEAEVNMLVKAGWM